MKEVKGEDGLLLNIGVTSLRVDEKEAVARGMRKRTHPPAGRGMWECHLNVDGEPDRRTAGAELPRNAKMGTIPRICNQ